MEYEDPKCPWCRVELLNDGSCPSLTHPRICPFCNRVTEQMICSSEQCIKNQPRSNNHSTFPPRTQMSFEGVQEGGMCELKAAKALRAVLRIEHPEDLILCRADGEEEETNPQIQIVKFVAGLLQPKQGEDSSVEPLEQERKISGVFLRNDSIMEMEAVIPGKHSDIKG